MPRATHLIESVAECEFPKWEVTYPARLETLGMSLSERYDIGADHESR